MSRMENELRKQKRLGPAPIASFEKSFEDNSVPVPVPVPVSCVSGTITTTATTAATEGQQSSIIVPTTIVTTSSCEKLQMDSGAEGEIEMRTSQNKTGAESPSLTSDTDDSRRQKTVSSARKLHDIGKRPPPLQQTGIPSLPSSPVITSTPPGTTSTPPATSSIVVTSKLAVNTPSTPRIDISRASSSSHHEDSRDSSPENVFEQVGTGTLQEAIGLGFREEGAMELRSSTEELYFMDPEQKREEQEKIQQARKSPVVFKFDEHQTYLQQHQRKDSASSEVAALLCISGRTSRISSVGSQGSAVSRLSAISGVSRSPSPHRMLLETSFCGPKPLENVVDGSIMSSVEPPTVEVLEQVLLARKHDPTQAVIAEGIKIQESPKKKLTNGDTKRKVSLEKPPEVKVTKTISTIGGGIGGATPAPAVAKIATRKGIVAMTKKDAGKPIVGVTPSGTEYIRIKLKPDHCYDDKGLAPNERVVDAPVTAIGVQQSEQAHRKPVSLSLGRDISAVEQRLTPSSSPKPVRHAILSREVCGSRSPSPAAIAVSRKSSFCSLFKPKDSPDSPRDRSRSRSKSRDRSTPQSQSGTPSKQKSVLAIFKPKRSGSKSKCSSPVDQDTMSQLDAISQVEFKFKPDHGDSISRPSSRLRYYDTPLDGKSIHIPLHTPPEEKEDRRFASNRETKESEKPVSVTLAEAPTTPSSQGTTAPTPPVDDATPRQPVPPALPQKQSKAAQKIENLDAIHTLPQDVGERERTWSLEVQRHSSQESQETVSWDNSSSANPRRISKPNLTDVIESPVLENGVPPAIVQSFIAQEPQQQQQQLQQQQQQLQQQQRVIPQNAGQHPPPTLPSSREKKRLLFATRIGSGSEEQIFSTQFSLSKTESLSSQLSEQTSIPDSPALEGRADTLHRTDTVIRRPDDASIAGANQRRKQPIDTSDTEKGAIQKKPTSGSSSAEDIKRKSKSTSEDEEKRPVVVMMRKKDLADECRRKSSAKSASEEDDSTNRHSRYIENFDHKKKFHHHHDTKRHQSSHNSSDSSIKERDSHTSSREDQDGVKATETQPAKPHRDSTTTQVSKAPTAIGATGVVERQSVISTDDLVESSESERDSEMDPNRIKRHLPRHIGAVEDHESTGLVSQDSFEDELPYVPTTLPEERAHGVPLIPMKERINMEVKTCSVDRPRSTTPMNPACLEEYCGIVTPDDNENVPVRGEKLRISLPRKDVSKDRQQKTKSPRRISNASGKSWFEFAEQGIRGSSSQTTPTQPCATELRRGSSQDDEPPPPLPPRKPATAAASSAPTTTGHWINFENIPEKRKAPKRITALPKDSPQDSKPPLSMQSAQQQQQQQHQQQIQYNYVKPEECQCECHEVERESAAHKSIANVDLLQQGEEMQPLLEPECPEGIDPSDSSVDYSYDTELLPSTVEQKPFEMDLSLGKAGSNRSSIHSQDPESPEQMPIIHDVDDAPPSGADGRHSDSPTDRLDP